MATRRPKLTKPDGAVLAANVLIHDAPDGPTWYGPSYPKNGEPPADLAAALPPHVWDARAVWATQDDAAAVGLEWTSPAPAADSTPADGGDAKGGA